MGKLFKATYWDGSTVDIASNGDVLTMDDNSNYEGERGLPVAADANSITLAVDADGDTSTYYDGFSVLIISGTNAGALAVIPSTGGNFNTATKKISNIAWVGGTPDTTSLYEISEQGHHKEDFSSIRKVNIILPGDTEYLLSSIGDGDASTVTPDGATVPISDVHAYTTGDGIFTVKLSVVPTYTESAAYSVGHHVYYNGDYWKCVSATVAGIAPVTGSYYWTVTTFDDLSVKYTDERKFYVDYDLREGRIKAAYKARNLANYPSDIPGIIKSRDFQNWEILDLIIETLVELVDKQAWDEIEHDINFGKTIVAYNE